MLQRLRAAARAPRWHASLPSRGVLVVEGKDARKLVQGLVTSDVTRLDDGPQFTSFLTPQGRVLHDAFLVRDELEAREDLLLESDVGAC